MKNKILSTILFIIVAISAGQAQEVNVNLRVSPPFDLGLDGLTNQLLATVSNTNFEEELTDVNFRLELYGPKGLRISSLRVFNDDLDLAPGEVRSFIGGDWEGLYGATDLLILPPGEKQRIIDTQTFRDGSYKICLTAYSTSTGQQLSGGVPSDCDDFTVEVPDPPKIVFPHANTEISNETGALQVNWFQAFLKSSPSYTLEIIDASDFPHSAFAVEETFERAETVFLEEDISAFSFTVEDVDWEEGHEYEIRVTASLGRNEGVLYEYKLHSRPVRISFEGNAVVADAFVPDTKEDKELPEIEEEIAEPEDVVVEAETQEPTETTEPPNTEEPAPSVVVVAPASDVPGTVAVNDTIRVGTNGEFELILTELTGTKSAYDGKGTVFIDWLQARVNVSFKKITIAEDKRILTGKVIADLNENPPTYPTDWGLEVITNNSWTNNMAGDVIDWAEGVSGQEVPYKNLNEFATPLSMPFGLNFDAENKLVLTEMFFDKDKSQFNIIAAKSTSLDWGEPQTVGFIAKEVKFHPASIEPTPKRLELVANVSIENTDLNTSYTFIAPVDARAGCYIEWGENGFSKFGLELESELSRAWLVPLKDDNPDRVKVTLTAEGAGWDDLLFTGNLEPSIIVGSGGIEIAATNISYDMSDVLNPTGITFPTNYQGETSAEFRGFYAKNAKLKLPEAWETSSNGALEIDVTNMIVDNMGVTMNADATNVADFSTTSVVDMAASVDKVHVEIIANSLTEATIEGKVALPISDVTEIKDDSKIDYSASLHIVSNNQKDKSNFQLKLNPTENQEIDFDLINSKFKIDNTSNIVAYVGEDKKTFDADLSGSVDIGEIEVGPLSLNSYGMKVEHLNFGYDSSPNGGFTFNKSKKMTWSKSSPQKYLATESSDKGFSLSFLSIDYEDKTKEAGEVMRGALLIETQVVLSDNIGGAGTIAITSAIKKDNNSLVKFKPVYVKTALDSLAVNAELSAVDIVGHVKIRDGDPVYGDGFKGVLDAQFKTMKAGVRAVAEFGTVTDFNYWRVQAGLDLPTPIVLAPGVSFYGFGGGAFYNMKATPNTKKDALWADKYTFKPKKNLAGLNLMATLGGPKIESYNADVEISAAIGTGANAGLKKIDISGNLWVGAKIEERAKAPIKGGLKVEFDFVNNIFDLKADANVNMQAITANNFGMQIYAEGETNKWFFKLGDPTKPNTINVKLLGLGVDVQSYFMFGNDIPVPKGFTPRFENGYKAALGKVPGFGPTTEATSKGSYADSGAGIALGIGFNFKAGGYFDLPRDYAVGVRGTAGAELNLSLLEYTYLKNKGLGYNGWQVGGSLGFYASVAAGVYEKNGEKYNAIFEIADFAGGGYIMGRFPNPVWAKGEIAGRVKALCLFGGCIINSSVSVGFEHGKLEPRGAPNVKVVKAEVNELSVESRDRVLENIDKHIVKYIHPETPFSFLPSSPIAVKYHTAPNEIFELPDLNKLRLFYFDTTVTLEEINPMTCQPEVLQLNRTTNDIGEKLYVAESKLNWPGKGIAISEQIANTNLPASMSFGNGNSSNAIKNNLAPQTNYRLVIHAVLKEKIGVEWKAVELDEKPIEETVEFKFRTGGIIIPNELAAADALFTKMPILDYYNMSDEERYTLNGGLSNIGKQNLTDKDFLFISEDGECECNRWKADDKLVYFSDLREGRNSIEALTAIYGPIKSYRDYPEVRSTSDAISRLGNQTITKDLKKDINQNRATKIDPDDYAPNTFNYSLVNTAKNGSFGVLK